MPCEYSTGPCIPSNSRHLLHHLAAQQVVRQPMTRGQDDDAVMYDLLGTKEYRSLHLRSYALCGQ